MREAEEIARLQARVAGLEAALERRSRDFRILLRTACDRDLLIISRVSAGLPPLLAGPYDIEQWPETHHMQAADIEETMIDLWDSVAPSERQSGA